MEASMTEESHSRRAPGETPEGLPELREAGTSAGGPPGVPRWVKVLAVGALLVILIVGVVVLTGVGGQHGPGRHIASTGNPPSAVLELATLTAEPLARTSCRPAPASHESQPPQGG